MTTSTVFLGLRPKKEDRRDLALASYVDRSRLQEAMGPAAFDWSAMPGPSGAPVGPDRDPLGNRRAGDCVFAAIGHQVISTARLTGREHGVDEAAVIQVYSDPSSRSRASGADGELGSRHLDRGRVSVAIQFPRPCPSPDRSRRGARASEPAGWQVASAQLNQVAKALVKAAIVVVRVQIWQTKGGAIPAAQPGDNGT